MMIPTEARATIAAYREGRTERQFIADMWQRRAAEHPVKRKSRWSWPVKDTVEADNVTPIKRKAAHNG